MVTHLVVFELFDLACIHSGSSRTLVWCTGMEQEPNMQNLFFRNLVFHSFHLLQFGDSLQSVVKGPVFLVL